MAELRRFSASVAQEWASEFDKRNEWTFFTKPEAQSFVIGRNLLARKGQDSLGKYCYIGRKRMGADTCTTVKFLDFEKSLVVDFIENVAALRQTELSNGRRPADFIFNMNGVTITSLDTANREAMFWDRPMRVLPTSGVKLSIAFNEKQGDFQICMNVPVSATISQKHRNWVGPVVDLSTNEMEAFSQFLNLNDV